MPADEANASAGNAQGVRPGKTIKGSMDEFIKEVAPFRLCLIGILAYAHDRDDQRLIVAIESVFARKSDVCAADSPSGPLSMRLLTGKMNGPERIWWQKATTVAKASPPDRAVLLRLAAIRLGR